MDAQGRPSKTQIRKLGERLRGGSPTADDLEMLRTFVASHAQSLDVVQAVLVTEYAQNPTNRMKTVTTIMDKLRRAPTMHLSSMQDIGGVRITDDWWLTMQTELANQLANRFPGSRTIDRRADPRHGYRAVHIVVPHGGVSIEIQLRTYLQHRWAMTNEGLARRLGRGIQYGERPSGAEGLLDQMLDISAAIAVAESRTDRALKRVRSAGTTLAQALTDESSPIRQALDEEQSLDEALAGIQDLLGGLQ